ncbi:CaiB/BaiF CoA transferase family protein [Oricola sp.]|uniref:CaiB/BaiF CoA transferase family protein n=1 Tax=Oricola sp. TaxID=1979950 RepID=UPI003516BA17
MAQALQGIKVLDFSHVVAGPLATHFLALNGAEVTKIEPPAGDPLRNYTLDPGQRGMAPAFAGINAGKESLVLNLKSSSGQQRAKSLAAEADIVVENFRPGVMDRLGLGYDSIRDLNPRVVYCSVSGFGRDNALRGIPAMDQIIQSLSGLMKISGLPGDPAMRVGFPIVDTFSGLLAAFAIQTALVQRERGLAEGQLIDVAMLDATLVMMLSVVNPLLMNGETPQRTGNRGFSRAPTSDTFATAEGEITIGAVEDKQVNALMSIIGLSHLLQEAEFSDRISRAANADALYCKIAEALAARPAKEWETLLHGQGVPAARVQEVQDALDMPHLSDRDLFMDLKDEAGGEQRILNAGYRFATGGPGVKRAAPTLGNHVEIGSSAQSRRTG